MQKTVSTFAEFKSAVEDAETTGILLGADINFSGGATIPAAKQTLIIDGGGHTITDNNSSSYSDTVLVPAGSKNTSVTVKNVVWSGRNYYGVVCVYDDSQNSGVTVTFDNISYKGPQPIYNRYGTTIIKDSEISVEKNGASSSVQEFAEANRLVFEGSVNVVSASSSTAVIWFPFTGSSFTVAENATLTITALSTYMFYTDGAAKPVFDFKKGSNSRFIVKNGLFYSSGAGAHIASSCVIGENASLYVNSSANNGVPLFKCSGNFTVSGGGKLFLIMPAKGTSTLMYFSATALINFSSPESVVLYSNGGKVFSFAAGTAASPNTVNIAAEQINYWTAAKTPFESAGGFDDIPATAVYKKDEQNTTITQKLTTNAVISTESNLIEGDSGYPLSSSAFDLTKASVLSFGSLNLSADRITDITTSVTGETASEAALNYADSAQTVSGTSSGTGSYAITIEKSPMVGETVTIKSNKNFLTKAISKVVTGSVSVTFLPDIAFNAFVSPKKEAAVERLNPDWFLYLTDTRPTGGKWELYLSLKSPLSSSDETIENAVVFSDGGTNTTVGETPVLIKSGVSEKAGRIEVGWDKTGGVILNIDPEKAYKKGNYLSVLNWNVEFE